MITDNLYHVELTSKEFQEIWDIVNNEVDVLDENNVDNADHNYAIKSLQLALKEADKKHDCVDDHTAECRCDKCEVVAA